MPEPPEREVFERIRRGEINRERVIQIFEHLAQKNTLLPGESEEHRLFRSMLEHFGNDKRRTLRAATFLNVIYHWAKGELAEELVESEYKRRLKELETTLKAIELLQSSQKVLEALHIPSTIEAQYKKLEELVGELSKHPDVRKHIYG